MFGEWASHSEQERQEIFRKYVENVEIYPDVKKDARVVKRIVFKFPVSVMGKPDGVQRGSSFVGEGTYCSMGENEVLGYINEFRWDKRGHGESVLLLPSMREWAP